MTIDTPTVTTGLPVPVIIAIGKLHSLMRCWKERKYSIFLPMTKREANETGAHADD